MSNNPRTHTLLSTGTPLTPTTYIYDNNGNMSKYTTPRPSIYDFAFNGVDKRTSLSSPLNKTTNYSYNKNKRLTQITRPSGKTIVNNYSNDRLVNTVTNEGTSNYTYLFANKLGSITKGSESVAFEYDGTLLTKTTQTGELNHISSFSYNNDFQVTSNTYAETTQNHTYDNDGLLITSGAYSLTRDAQNAYVTNVTDGTVSQSKTYNNYGEINKVEDNIFSYELSQRDNAGAITQKIETINGISNTYDYRFDNMGRLIQVKKDNTLTEEYSYDNNGNRASATVDGTNIVASYTLDDQLEVYGDNTYLYNDDGYLSEKITPNGTTTYTYGTLGELKEVITPTQSITYQQNANNQRVAKLINGEVVEKYLWANLTTLLAIYDKDNNLVQRFEYAEQRMPISMTQNNEKYYLHYDQVGTLKAVSDSSLNVVKEISYDTYGNILLETNENLKIPFGFAGGLYDADTKLTRFGYRDYDAETGKWTAKDPIGFAGGDANLYGYVLGDPVNLFDVEGLEQTYYEQFLDYLVRVNRLRQQNEENFNRASGKLYKDAGTVACGVLATDNANKLYRARKLFPKDIYTGQKGAMVSLATGGKYPGTILLRTGPSLFGASAWWLGLEGGFVLPAYYDALEN